MYINKRLRNGIEFKYLEYSYRLGNKVKKVSIYLQKNKKFIFNFEKNNKNIFHKIAKDRIKYYKKNFKINDFFLYENILENIELIRIKFKILYSQLTQEQKKELMKEYIKIFTVNSMEMEGGTITYEIAQKIDNKKLKKTPTLVNEKDIILYKNILETYKYLKNKNIRTSTDIKKLHAMIYNKVYVFAGKFRKKHATFGSTEDAITSNFKNIRKDLVNAIKRYKQNKTKIYCFENIIKFHADYQGVHPFENGNSRLGRLILMKEFFSQGYPAPILKKNNSHTYRSSLVRAINNQNYKSLLKLYYKMYKQSWNKFFKPFFENKLIK